MPPLSLDKIKSFRSININADKKDSVFIFNDLSARKPLFIRLVDSILGTIMCQALCCCWRQRRLKKDQRLLYNEAKTRIEHSLDVKRMLKQLRILKALSYIFLSNTQLYLLPYLNQNLLKIKESHDKVGNKVQVASDEENLNDTSIVEGPPKNKKEKKERLNTKHKIMLKKSVEELFRNDNKSHEFNDRILNFLYHDVEKTKT